MGLRHAYKKEHDRIFWRDEKRYLSLVSAVTVRI